MIRAFLRRWFGPRLAYVRVRKSKSFGFLAWGGLRPLVATDPLDEPAHRPIWWQHGTDRATIVRALQAEMAREWPSLRIFEVLEERVCPGDWRQVVYQEAA